MPRAALSAQVIVTEAANLADEVGPDRLTLAELARRFGVAQPSLYKHIAGLDAVQGKLAVKVARDLADTLRRASSGKAASQALGAVANAYRHYARTHPGCYGYLVRAPSPDEHDLAAAAADIVSVLYAVFAGYGITGTAAVDAARFVRSALHGFVTLELSGGFGMPRSVDASFDRLVTATDRALTGW